jgi:hypothetical protein
MCEDNVVLDQERVTQCDSKKQMFFGYNKGSNNVTKTSVNILHKKTHNQQPLLPFENVFKTDKFQQAHIQSNIKDFSDRSQRDCGRFTSGIHQKLSINDFAKPD